MRRPAGRLAASTSSDRAQRRRARVVGVVEHRDAGRRAAAPRRGGRRGEPARGDRRSPRAARRARRRRRWRRAHSRGGRGRAAQSTAVASPADVTTSARDAGHAAILDGGGPHVGAGRLAERDDPAGERRRAGHHQRVVGVADERVPGPACSRISALASAIAVARAEVADVGVADVGPDPHVGPGDVDEHADLAGVVHAELHHGDVGRRAQLHQRDRQAEVVVQVAAVLHHPVAGAEHGGDRVLGGGLAGAAGDGDDARARGAAHRPRQVLQARAACRRPRRPPDRRCLAARRPAAARRRRRRRGQSPPARSRGRRARRRWRRTARPGPAAASRWRPGRAGGAAEPASCRPAVACTRSAAL